MFLEYEKAKLNEILCFPPVETLNAGQMNKERMC